jgi:hypothetical protein
MIEIDVTMVDRINKLHNQAEQAVYDSLSFAMDAGELLADQKAKMPHGLFTEWVQQNLVFSPRTAQAYMRIAQNRAQIEDQRPGSISEALKTLSTSQEKEKMAEDPNVIKGDFEVQTEDEEEAEAPRPKQPELDTLYDYWKIVGPLVDEMNLAYNRLSADRDHTTPSALANFIGNIKDMADRISTWNPKRLYECPACEGTTQIESDDGIPTTCPMCLDGKLGPYKKSEN